MRDKKDNATLDLVGFDATALPDATQADGVNLSPAPARRARRERSTAPRQHQLELLDPTDATGLPVWQRDEGLDVTGLPVWAAA
ncbi:MAG: hypothetical protein ACJ8HI_05400 [Massilia sp.]